MSATEALGSKERALSAAQLRSFALLSVFYAALTAAAMLSANVPALAEPKIVVVYGIAILVADLCTAALLGALYRSSGRPALLLLTCAYLYSGVMAGVHMAAYPGALAAQPMFGGQQTVGWLFVAWRGGMAALLLAAVAVASKGAPARSERLGARLLAACSLTIAAIAMLASAAARLEWQGASADQLAETLNAMQWTAFGLCAAALVGIWRKGAFGDSLYLWLGLTLVTMMAGVGLSSASEGP